MATDLSTLISQLGPGVGAQWAGQQEALSQQGKQADNQRLAALAQELQQKMQFAEQDQPLSLEKMRLTNQGLAAGLPGIAADSLLKGTAADYARDTLAAKTKFGNADYADKEETIKTKKAAQLGDTFTKAGAWLGSLPPVQRAGALLEHLRAQGLPIDGPAGQPFLGIIKNTSAENLPDVLIQNGRKMVEMSEAYMKHLDGIKENNVSQEKIGAANNRTTLAARQMDINAGKYAKKESDTSFEGAVNSALSKAKSAKDQHAILLRASVMAEQTGNAAKAVQYREQAEALRPQAQAEIASARPGTPDLAGATNGRIPVQGMPQIAPPSGGLPSAKPAQVPASLSSVSKLYPGVPPEKLREAYKKKFGVDLK